jgi:hypothetical protein
MSKHGPSKVHHSISYSQLVPRYIKCSERSRVFSDIIAVINKAILAVKVREKWTRVVQIAGLFTVKVLIACLRNLMNDKRHFYDI